MVKKFYYEKLILFCLALSLVNLILIKMVALTVEENMGTIDRIAPSKHALRYKYERLGPTRLIQAEVKHISNKLKAQISLLNQIEWVMKFAAVIMVFVILWVITKIQLQILGFNRFALLILTSLLFGLHWLFEWFGNKFEGAHNATIDLRIYAAIGLLIIQLSRLLGLNFGGITNVRMLLYEVRVVMFLLEPKRGLFLSVEGA